MCLLVTTWELLGRQETRCVCWSPGGSCWRLSVFVGHQVGAAGTAGDSSCPTLTAVDAQPESKYYRTYESSAVICLLFMSCIINQSGNNNFII